MKKKILIGIKCLLGISWIAVFMHFGISMFMSGDTWVEKLLIDQNVETNKKFTGGEMVREIKKQNYTIVIHEAVYVGVFKHTDEPFIQVDWLSHSELPHIIEDALDITGDNKLDISVKINTIDLSIEYEALREDIKGLLDKGSLADIKVYISINAYNGLFFYNNKDVGDIIYEKGVSTRIIFNNTID